MIQSAMLFALGFLVSGLLWLAFSVALVRRARRLTERRTLAGIAIRRSEFEAERDELRARHAVDMHRLEREVSRVLDMAAAHRLEVGAKEKELANARADLAARHADLHEAQLRLAAQQETVEELERRNAAAGAELRAAQHALKLEVMRRTIAEEALDEAKTTADQRRTELAALRAHNDALRSAAGEIMPFEQPEGALPRIVVPAPTSGAPLGEPPRLGGSVVQLATRTRHSAAPAEAAEALVNEAARDLHRLAGEGHGEPGAPVVRRAPAEAELVPPAAGFPSEPATVAELAPRRNGVAIEDGAKPDREEGADARFFEALAEIRALKRAASQAGE